MVNPPGVGGSTGGATATINLPSEPGPSTNNYPLDLSAVKNGIYTAYAPHIPFSQRRAPPLDLSTVERRGQPSAARETRRARPHGLQEAPTFRPTEEEFKDPFDYIRTVRPEAEKYGICKIIPPDTWSPEFAINTERFFFKTRLQQLNSVEGGSRQNVQYLDQLAKFHKQHGMNLNRFPSVDKRPLDLYKLKKAVECRGGFEKVCKLKKWAEIGRDLGYSGKIMSSLSTSLKNSYAKWLNPYEEYLKVAKPGVQQQLEFENGGPFTPSCLKPFLNGSQQSTPLSLNDESPAIKASAALNTSLNDQNEPVEQKPLVLDQPQPPTQSQPVVSTGFTPVNPGGFTPVNASQASFRFAAVNGSQKYDLENGGHRSPPQPPFNGGLPQPQINENSFIAHLPNGHPNPLKRSFGTEGKSTLLPMEGSISFDSTDSDERRSKRVKKAPTVVGSHMNQPRPVTPRLSSGQSNGKKGEACEVCGTKDDRSLFLVCDGCDYGYHKNCLDPPAKTNPLVDWHCPKCLVGTGDFGFQEGGVYSLRQFQEKARHFKQSYFEPKMQYDPVTNKKKTITEDDVEKEFWRLVESPSEEVEVEYGADIHSTTHGSGFPIIEKHPLDPYSIDHWNLNILPYHPDSLFKHINSDISGMTIPWLYVGMCFSTFCWHNEDHYAYSANYQHFGATKTWYGIPGADAVRFEQAMREAVPELFESQPDLLFQLVTLLPPDRLKKAGVNVYALDQRAGQFVITFPQAYHAGFNHGFNFNEAVNFAPDDWEHFGEDGVKRLQEFRKQPCFSHDELLTTAAQRDTTIKTARWLAPALQRLGDRECHQRLEFLQRHKECSHAHHCKVDRTGDSEPECELDFEVLDVDVPEADYQCVHCKAYSYLSTFRCTASGKVMCLLHAGNFECCETSEEQRYRGARHVLRYRLSDQALGRLVQRAIDKANQPQAWQEKVSKVLEGEESPSLKTLQSLVNEGEKIPWDLPGLMDLKTFVTKCNEWVEEAQNYITRKQQNRRKNERAWRKGKTAKADEVEEREKDLRKIENVNRLLHQAESLGFDCPQITTLRDRSEAIAEFQKNARAALANPKLRTTVELEELAESGKGFNVDVPEVEELEAFVKKQKWTDQAVERRNTAGQTFKTLTEVKAFIAKGLEVGVAEEDDHLAHLKSLRTSGELWEEKVCDVMAMDIIHHPQLEALAAQAENLPITEETRAKIDSILSKQREAQKMIKSLFDRSQESDSSKRPKYKEAREALDGLNVLNSKPHGAMDLENALKRHENWMRKGKKLFGKANAPLHILHQHLTYVAERNSFCFDPSDKPRMPVEPATRENTPVEGEENEGVRSEKNVFCMCRQPESGTMLECELCLEWYHSKCLKIARGKVKEDDKYNCPICDYRVKIPRDAARPKLEDLTQWQEEIPDLPFQPEEEGILDEIVNVAQAFRDFLRPHINPMMTIPSEVTTQRFYLRKIEGAEILLSFETNFFRQEVHKWAPVAKEPPPVLEQSLSTRKPRPTKAQKLMQQHGVSSPEELPLQFRTKAYYQPGKSRQGSDPTIRPIPVKRPTSSHSASTDQSSNPQAQERRAPPPISTGYRDANYAADYPVPPSHDPHSASMSPRYAGSPYFASSNGQHTQSPFGHQPSPLSATQPPLDTSLFDTGAESPFEHPHARLPSTPPEHNFPGDTSPPADVDRIFDEFVTHPEDDINDSNEVAEALEDRGREQEAETTNGYKDDAE
ncbi:uncharacterized protein KY384_005260 [Bacidia gigantensis]|uniref:uncharacterized protein n=1 Tax=Bacidia gigantensis TaxID=2732470 RepID=UPI001D03AE6E|nr:uncharacterized protein KY384_005260 [Bacidia gigantensis]KAG8529779.1 hypothetical protein KY384_005260 [Bacidia gigantensis]